ncbi:hypothetical protein [Microcoleus sp. herbarium12]
MSNVRCSGDRADDTNKHLRQQRSMFGRSRGRHQQTSTVIPNILT